MIKNEMIGGFGNLHKIQEVEEEENKSLDLD